MGQTIEFTRPDGARAPGYLAEPQNAADAPGIVVIEEWWGVTGWIKSIADRYAAAGYRALIPDLFRGRTAAVGDEANHLVEGLDFGDAATQDVRGAVQYLKQNGSGVGVTGYCMGGALTLLSAMYVPEVEAAVSFYGFPPPQAGDLSAVQKPVECHFALHDDFFAPERGREIEQQLTQSNPDAHVYWYDAKHAFCNPNDVGNAGLGHLDEAACESAWRRTMEFWRKHLSKR